MFLFFFVFCFFLFFSCLHFLVFSFFSCIPFFQFFVFFFFDFRVLIFLMFFIFFVSSFFPFFGSFSFLFCVEPPNHPTHNPTTQHVTHPPTQHPTPNPTPQASVLASSSCQGYHTTPKRDTLPPCLWRHHHARVTRIRQSVTPSLRVSGVIIMPGLQEDAKAWLRASGLWGPLKKIARHPSSSSS